MGTRVLSLFAITACGADVMTSDPSGGNGGNADATRPSGIGDGHTIAATTCGPVAVLASIADDGKLALEPVGTAGDASWPEQRSAIGDGWNLHASVLPSGHGTVYVIDDDGHMRWYRHRAGELAAGAGATIATGWLERSSVVSGGDGVFYSVDAAGRLIWDRHVDPFAGSAVAWRRDGDAVVADGWGAFVAIVPGGDGVLYTIDRDGALRWFRHLDPFGGEARWAPGSGAIIGADWDRATAVMSAGGGVLYAELADGTLLWFRHLDPVRGSSSWQQLDGVPVAGATPATLGDLAACYLGAGPIITSAPQLHYGLHPRASDALRAIGIGVDRITQTIGTAPASAGTHAQDGSADGLPYSAATDLSVRGWSDAKIKDVLDKLGQVGFAAWYRKPGDDGWPSTASAHIHAVYAGCPMKLVLRDQVRDWLQDKNGLVSHTAYSFFDWSDFAHDRVRKLFLAENPGLD